MEISVDKLKAIIGVAIDRRATDLIKNISEDKLSLKDFSYYYDVLVERQFVSLVVEYCSNEILKVNYFYMLRGSDDGAIKISLSDLNDDEVLRVEFEPEFDFDAAMKVYNPQTS